LKSLTVHVAAPSCWCQNWTVSCASVMISRGVNDTYPMPRVDELIDRLRKARYISTLDLTKGYWQVPLAACGYPQLCGYSFPHHRSNQGPPPEKSEMDGRDRSGVQPPEISAGLPSDSRNARFPGADGEEQPIMYISRKLIPREKKVLYC
jgi:hypothetical protein